MKLVKFLLIFSILVTGACSVRDTKSVRATQDFYFTYINRPAELDLEDARTLKEIEKMLSLRFALFDKELTSLARSLDAILNPTDVQAVSSLIDTYPWISNCYILNPKAEIGGSIPPQYMDGMDFSYLNSITDLKSRELYANILTINDQKIFLLARPYLINGELAGYLAINFDIHSLLPLVGDASNAFIRTVTDVLYSGNASASLVNTDWKMEIDKDSLGVDNNHAWIVRYYANMPLIYGITSLGSGN